MSLFSSPWSPESLVALAVAASIIWLRPMVGLALICLISPLSGMWDQIGWDPRLYLCAVLSLRALADHAFVRESSLPSSVRRLWIAFSCVLLISFFLGSRQVEAAEAETARSFVIYYFVGSGVVFAFAQFIRSEEEWRGLLKYVAMSVATAAAIALSGALRAYGSGDIVGRVAGTIGNANYLGTYMALAATGLLLLSRHSVTPSSRWRLRLVALLALAACIVTLSRTGIVASLAGVLLVMAWRKRQAVVSPRVIAMVAIVAVLGVTVVWTQLVEVRNRLTFSDDPAQADFAALNQAAEDVTRFRALTFAMEIMMAHPVIGIGFSTFAARNYDANGLYVTTHNTFLQVLTGTGLLGTLLFLRLLWELGRKLGTDGRRIFFPVAVTMSICSLFGDYLHTLEIILLLTFFYLFCMFRAEAHVVEGI